MSKTEFAPPIPITNVCGFCNTKIPEKQIMTTGITCVDCKRPVCPSCKTDINQVGLDGCPYCETIHLDDSNVGVKRALKEIYEKKLIERKQKIEKQVSGQDDETPWMTTSYGTGTPVVTNTSWSASSSSQPFVPGTPVTQDDQYPYRPSAYPPQWEEEDPLAEPMDKPKKKIDHEDNENMQMMEALGLDKKLYPYQKKWLKGKFPGPDKEDIRITQRFTPAPHKPSNISGIASVTDVKEEAQRGTGRSTQRQLTALNHFFDRTTGKHEAGRSVLFVVNNQRMLKEAKRNIMRLYAEEYTRSNIQRGVFDKVMDNIHFWNVNQPIKGIHPTLVVIDLVAPITYAQKIYLNRFLEHVPCVGTESIMVEYEPARGWAKPSQPLTTSIGKRNVRSRKEKPPRTALRCFKCGHKPDECVCDQELSLWQRFKQWIKRR